MDEILRLKKSNCKNCYKCIPKIRTPLMGKIEGVDLTTEGILTINRVLQYAEDYLADNNSYVQWCYSRQIRITYF